MSKKFTQMEGEELGWKGFKEKVEFWGVDTTFKALSSHRNEAKVWFRGVTSSKCFFYSQ